jgi:type I site-specific restriction-modification system R (restriction) subunit
MTEEEKIQIDFSNKVGKNIAQSKKIIGFIKRYILIGIVTGAPGIAIAYLCDKWQENKMVKDLYDKNIELVTSSNSKGLAKEYELLRKKLHKAYDIDKIEKLLMESDEIKDLKNDKKAIQKLNEEIKKYREEYTKNLGNYIEKQIILEQKEKNQEIIAVEDTEEEEELEIRR